jgi:hypothetical protein
MSETNSNPNKHPVNLTTKAKAIGAGMLLALGIGAAEAPNAIDAYQDHKEEVQLENNLQRPDALQEYLKGDQIPHDKAVRMEVPNDMPANSFAKEIKNTNGDQWELTQQIQPQVDAQGDPGAQAGEQVVVEKDRVDPAAIKEFGVEDINDPNRVDPATTELPQPMVPDESGFNPNTPR